MIPRGTVLTADNLNKYFLSGTHEVTIDQSSGMPVFVGGRVSSNPPYTDRSGAHFWNENNDYARITAGTNDGGIWVSATSDTIWLGASNASINVRGELNINSDSYGIHVEANELKFKSHQNYWFTARSGYTPSLRVYDSSNNTDIRLYKSSAGVIETNSGSIILRPGGNDRFTVTTSGNVSWTGQLTGGSVPAGRITGVLATSNIPTITQSMVSFSSLGVGPSSSPQSGVSLYVRGGSGFFDTASGSNPFIIARGAHKTSNHEEIRVSIADAVANVHYINDESSSRIDFRLQNTDTEVNSGENANDYTVLTISGGTHGGRVGIRTTSPAYRLDVNGNARIGTTLYLGDSNTRLHKASSYNMLRITNNTGYVDIGSESSTWASIYTDRAQFYFNKPVHVAGNILPYGTTGTRDLGSTSNRWRHVYIQGHLYVGSGSQNRPIRYVNESAVSYRIVLPVGSNKFATQ